MSALINSKKKIALDIRSGSFCIYSTDTLQVISTGTLEGFRNNHESMRIWAIKKYDELCK